MQGRKPTLRRQHEIVTVRGYGVKLRVSGGGQLEIDDGFARQRRLRKFHRTAAPRRLVIIARNGYMTFDVVRWLSDVGSAYVHLDPNGEVLATSVANGRDLPALRRAQALAADGPAGIEISKYLLKLKIEGQRDVLAQMPGANDARAQLDDWVRRCDGARSIDELLEIERGAAGDYFEAWSTLPVKLIADGRRQVPEHWRTFGARASLLTGGPRRATNPANASLNLLYMLARIETVFACHELGLDPGIGVFHRDREGRESLADDAVEGIRPVVDAYLFALLTQRTFSVRDFVEDRDGSVRVAPRLAEQLADTLPVWREHVGPVVEQVAHTLRDYSPSTLPALTPITRSNWKRAWDERAPDRRQRRSRSDFAQLPSTCRDCGAPLEDRRRRYCDNCRAERFANRAPAGRQRAAEVLAQLRSEQRDPAHGGRAAEIRGRKNAAHQVAVREWQGERPDPEVFRIEILPGLRRTPIGELVAATGLSEHYCSLIRLGKKTPHPRHWNALRGVVGDTPRSMASG
jgi:CRISPR-associated endonuclease Cas1